MNCLQTAIIGLMQGLTEFLPVSSSAHIVLVNDVYSFFTKTPMLIESPEEYFLDIVVHLGTVLAILIYFRKEILSLLKAFFKAVFKWDFSSYEAKICLYILLGTLFTAIAFPLKPAVEYLTLNPYLIGLCLIITGFVLFFSEKISQKFSKEKEKLDVKKSIIIGIAQGIAVFPGFSRSGLTIATGLATGLTRVKAAKYSFLLSLPAIIGASCLYPILELSPSQIMSFNLKALFIGFIVSAVVGYFCIKYFVVFLAKYSLNVFAYYCWVVGFVTLILLNPWIKALIHHVI